MDCRQARGDARGAAWSLPAVVLLDLPLALPSLDLPMLGGLMGAGLGIGLLLALPVLRRLSALELFEADISVGR